MDTVSAATKNSSDRMYQTGFPTLARQLHLRGLSAKQKSIVDEAQAKGKNNYKKGHQVKAVREIVEMVAVNPPIAVVSRLIAPFNKVTNCQRNRSESLSSFVSRSRGLAANRFLFILDCLHPFKSAKYWL